MSVTTRSQRNVLTTGEQASVTTRSQRNVLATGEQASVKVFTVQNTVGTTSQLLPNQILFNLMELCFFRTFWEHIGLAPPPGTSPRKSADSVFEVAHSSGPVILSKKEGENFLQCLSFVLLTFSASCLNLSFNSLYTHLTFKMRVIRLIR